MSQNKTAVTDKLKSDLAIGLLYFSIIIAPAWAAALAYGTYSILCMPFG